MAGVNGASRFLLWVCVAVLFGSPANSMTVPQYLVTLGYTEVRLERGALNHLFADGKTNGRRARIMIDTGCDVAFIDPAKTSGMRQVAELPRPLVAVFGPLMSQGSVVAVDRLEIGTVLYEQEPAVVTKLHAKRVTPTGSLIPERGPGIDTDVIIGWEFLSRHKAIIVTSVPAVYLLAKEPETDVATAFGQALLATGYGQVPLVRRGMKVEVAAAINGHPAAFWVDTGAASTVLDATHAKDLDVDVYESHAEAEDIGGHRKRLREATVKSFRLGDVNLNNMAVGVVDLREINAFRERNGQPVIHGLVGLDVLSRRLAVIDCANLRLYPYDRQPPSK